jgi:hypothetical protein
VLATVDAALAVELIGPLPTPAVPPAAPTRPEPPDPPPLGVELAEPDELAGELGVVCVGLTGLTPVAVVVLLLRSGVIE